MTQHFQREIKKLKKKIFKEAEFVEQELKQALEALDKRDLKLAEQVIKADDQLDEMEIDIEEDALKILALYQPVAKDLRFIIAVIKLNNDLERIGDLATNIAERVPIFANKNQVVMAKNIFTMADLTGAMVNKALNALVNMDKKLAISVCVEDDKVDDLHREMYDYIIGRIKNDEKNAEIYLHQLGVSRYLERIADHATNIAEDVIYMVSGKIARHK